MTKPKKSPKNKKPRSTTTPPKTAAGAGSSPSVDAQEQQQRQLLGLVYDERMSMHEDPLDPAHPEQPARIAAIFDELKFSGLLRGCRRFPVRSAVPAELTTVHTVRGGSGSGSGLW